MQAFFVWVVAAFSAQPVELHYRVKVAAHLYCLPYKSIRINCICIK
jgi:hypothetical protein